jgi:hypothetical protein
LAQLICCRQFDLNSKKYYVKSIPHVLFVHPDGVTETLDLSEAGDIRRLYNIVAM